MWHSRCILSPILFWIANAYTFIIKFHRKYNECLMCNKIIVKLWAKHFDEHLTFVCHENTQCNQNYCHEKTIWCERDAFVLNLDFPNIKTFALSIALPSIIRNTAFGLTTVILRTLKKSSSFVVWNKIKYFTILTNVGICITMYIFNSIKEIAYFIGPLWKF